MLTKELIARAGAAAIDRAQAEFAKAMTTLLNATFLDANVAIALERPAGILYGSTAVGSGSPFDAEPDISLLGAAVAGGAPVAP